MLLVSLTVIERRSVHQLKSFFWVFFSLPVQMLLMRLLTDAYVRKFLTDLGNHLACQLCIALLWCIFSTLQWHASLRLGTHPMWQLSYDLVHIRMFVAWNSCEHIACKLFRGVAIAVGQILHHHVICVHRLKVVLKWLFKTLAMHFQLSRPHPQWGIFPADFAGEAAAPQPPRNLVPINQKAICDATLNTRMPKM